MSTLVIVIIFSHFCQHRPLSSTTTSIFVTTTTTTKMDRNSSSASSSSSGSTPQDTTSVLRSASFSTGQTSQNHDTVVTASELLSGSFDPARLHPLANLKDSLEYLVLDDDKTNDLPGAGTALPSRGWSDDLQYGTGTTYLSGE